MSLRNHEWFALNEYILVVAVYQWRSFILDYQPDIFIILCIFNSRCYRHISSIQYTYAKSFLSKQKQTKYLDFAYTCIYIYIYIYYFITFAVHT